MPLHVATGPHDALPQQTEDGLAHIVRAERFRDVCNEEEGRRNREGEREPREDLNEGWRSSGMRYVLVEPIEEVGEEALK